MAGTRPVGPSRTGPWCFVMLKSCPHESSIRPTPKPYLGHGGVFMSPDPALAGDILRIVAARSDFVGAFQAVLGAGWTPYTHPYTAVRATGLVGAVQAGDVWAVVEYYQPQKNRPARSRYTRVGDSVSPPIVYYGIVPFADETTTVTTIAKAAEDAEIFFIRLIVSHFL